MANIQRIPEPPKTPELGNPEASPIDPTPNLPPVSLPKTDAGVSTAKAAPAPPEKRGPGRPPGSGSKSSIPKSNPATAAGVTKPVTGTGSVKGGKTAPPSFDEWQDFISGVVLHWITKAFVTVMLRGIDRKFLTEEDLEDIELDDDELLCIAKPFSNLLLKSNFGGKYGRAIINARDSIESIVMLAMWANRVNRVGNKYRPKHARKGKDTASNVTDIATVRRDNANVNGNRPNDGPRTNEPERTTEVSAPVWSFAAGYGPPGTGFN